MFGKIKELLWKRKYIFLFIGLFIIVLTQRFLNERQNGLTNSISSDGLGYYCYLPAAIIYQDFGYSYYYKDENKIKPFYRPYLNPYKDKSLNKYYCGTAICVLPFFLTGIVISAIAGTEINGYTDTFLMLISIGALVYYLLSIFLISKIGRFFSISEKTSIVTSLVFFFGTNLFHYVIQEPSMSHAYSFFAVSLFLYLFVRLIENTTNKNLLFLGLSLGLLSLIRPVNVVVILFTPFFFQNFNEYLLFLKKIFTNHLKGVILLVTALIAAVSLQFTFYYLQTGDFFIVSYEGETFNFTKPQIYNTLFSYRKGLLLYTPIIIASFLFILVIHNNWYKKLFFFITFSLFLYITASWWCWWYGGGFSIRPFIDILPLFIITIMLIYNKLSVNIKKLIFALSIPFLFLNQLMAFQYSNLIMLTDQMDKDKYWDIFLETDLATINEKKIARILKDKSIVKTEILNYEGDINDDRIVNGGYKSNKACVVGNKNLYSKGFGFPIKELNINESFYLIVECMAKTSKEGKDLGLDISIDENGKCVKWDIVFRNQFPKTDDGWVKMTEVVEIDRNFINDKNYLKIFANTDKGENLVDNLKYTIVKK